MVREEHLWLHRLCCLDKLFGGHRVRLVAWQEGDVDILDILHLWNVFRIAGDVDAQSVKGKDIAVVATFRVELCVTLRGVIGRHCHNSEVIGCLQFVAIAHHLPIAQHVSAALVGYQSCLVIGQRLDGLFVRHEDVVGFGYCAKVNSLPAQLCHWVNLYLLSVILDSGGLDDDDDLR